LQKKEKRIRYYTNPGNDYEEITHLIATQDS